MADRHAALQPKRGGARRDLAKLETAERPGIVEMDVETDAVTLGD
jgi:hypothetical protein